MSVDEYINQIRGSGDFSESAKSKAITLLTSKPISPSLLDEVQSILDADIDQMLKNAGALVDQVPTSADIPKRMDEAEAKFTEGMKLVEEETKKLEEDVAKADALTTETKIEALKKDLAGNSPSV